MLLQINDKRNLVLCINNFRYTVNHYCIINNIVYRCWIVSFSIHYMYRCIYLLQFLFCFVFLVSLLEGYTGLRSYSTCYIRWCGTGRAFLKRELLALVGVHCRYERNMSGFYDNYMCTEAMYNCSCLPMLPLQPWQSQNCMQRFRFRLYLGQCRFANPNPGFNL